MMKNKASRRVGRILLTSLLVVNLMLGYLGQATLVSAAPIIPDAIDTTKSGVTGAPQYGGVQDSIRDYLCVPDDSNLGTALFTCITKLYRFGIAFGGIALVFFIVFAGYMYMTGGESSKEKAKGILLSGLTGMAIMLSSYVLLNFINPDLVKIKPIQPPIFSATDLPKCEDVGFGQDCVLPSGQVQVGSGGGERGQCTAANLGSCTAWNVKDAIKICTAESKGDTAAVGKADPCLYVNDSSGTKIPGTDGFAISYGLFQIVPSTAGANGFPECVGVLDFGGVKDCPVPTTQTSGGTKYCPKRKCTAPKGLQALQTCVNAIKSSKEKQIQTACTIYTKACQAGKGPFSDWTTKEQLSSTSCTK